MELIIGLVNTIAVLAIIAGLALAGWWHIGLHWVHTRRQEEELPEVSLPANLHERFTGIPAVLVIFYIWCGLWMFGYILYTWLGGVTY
ncbi:MAG: hypothetical protein ABFD54_08445 [Armatimonadota bacterium]|nr:hypothetical protein [bacterium]